MLCCATQEPEHHAIYSAPCAVQRPASDSASLCIALQQTNNGHDDSALRRPRAGSRCSALERRSHWPAHAPTIARTTRSGGFLCRVHLTQHDPYTVLQQCLSAGIVTPRSRRAGQLTSCATSSLPRGYCITPVFVFPFFCAMALAL